METQFYSLRDAAEVLTVQPYRIVYLLTTGQATEPMRIGGKRIFSIADLNQLAEKLNIKNIQDVLEKRARSEDA